MIYFIQSEATNHIKIGFTESDDASVRLATLQTGNANRLRLLGTIPGTLEDEKNLHRLFAAHRVSGEWFEPAPEVLAAVVAIQPLKCGDTEVVTQTVSIRVLTVGRKNFTKRILDQLGTTPAGNFFWSDKRFSKENEGKQYEDYTVRTLINGNPWGWIRGGKEPIGSGKHIIRDVPDGDEEDESCDLVGEPILFPYCWSIYERNGRLFKCKDYREDLLISMVHNIEYRFAEAINRVRLKTPGFRDEDQLFIGV